MLCRLRCSGTDWPASVAEDAVVMETDWQPCAVWGRRVDTAGGRGAVGDVRWVGALNGRCFTSTQARRFGLACTTVGRVQRTAWCDFLHSDNNSKQCTAQHPPPSHKYSPGGVITALPGSVCWFLHFDPFQVLLLSASLYFSKRGAYWDRLCRDVVGRWLSRACTVAKRCILGL